MDSRHEFVRTVPVRVAKRLVPKPARILLRHTWEQSRVLWQRHVDPGFARRIARWQRDAERPEVSIVLVTFNRLRMLRECLTSLLDQTPRPAFEVIVWDNASDDGTSAYLDELAARNPVLRIVHSPSNIGVNGVARGVKLARGFFIVELDDDVVSFPPDWLYRMVETYKRVPRAGYLAANVVQDEKTNGARYLTETYIPHDYGDGVVIEEGPTGGWCTITSLETLRDIGNFKRLRGRIYFGEDGDFAGRCLLSGRVVGLVRDVVVYHAAGPLLNQEYGCLDVCEQKYADGREYADILEETRRLGAT